MPRSAEPPGAAPGRRRLLGWLAVALLAGTGGAAVSAHDPPPRGTSRPDIDAHGGGPPGKDRTDATILAASEPTVLTIPRIGVRAPVGQVGLVADGTIDTPPLDQPALTAWYRDGPTPGEPGPAVILGHVDSRDGPAVFHRLRDLRPGDRVEVTRRDGSSVVFVVDGVERVPKTAFPTQRVYGDQPGPVLRLVTCGGEFDRSRGSYRDNVVVYASFASYRESG